MESLYQRQEIREREKGNMENMYSFCLAYLVHSATVIIQIKLWEFDGKSQTFSLWIIKKEKLYNLHTFRVRGFALSPVFPTVLILRQNRVNNWVEGNMIGQ